jgi:hypothetical protein
LLRGKNIGCRPDLAAPAPTKFYGSLRFRSATLNKDLDFIGKFGPFLFCKLNHCTKDSPCADNKAAKCSGGKINICRVRECKIEISRFPPTMDKNPLGLVTYQIHPGKNCTANILKAHSTFTYLFLHDFSTESFMINYIYFLLIPTVSMSKSKDKSPV